MTRYAFLVHSYGLGGLQSVPKNVHNARTQVMHIFCNIATFIPCMNEQSKFSFNLLKNSTEASSIQIPKIIPFNI